MYISGWFTYKRKTNRCNAKPSVNVIMSAVRVVTKLEKASNLKLVLEVLVK